MQTAPRYPEETGRLESDDSRVAGIPLLGINPGDWPGAQDTFNRYVAGGTLIASTTWTCAADSAGVKPPVAILEVSFVDPASLIKIALHSETHRETLHGIVAHGRLALVTTDVFERLQAEPEGVDQRDVLVIDVRADELDRFLRMAKVRRSD